VTRDGQLVPVLRSTAPLTDRRGRVIGVLDTLVDITEHKRLDDESCALAQVRERELIAMDLHDGLVQQLYGLALGLVATERDASLDLETARASLRYVRGEIDHVIDEARRYLFDLKARELLPPNLGGGLRLLVDTLRLNGHLAAELRLDATADAQLEAEVRGQLLYVAREAASNILRHAAATSACIEVKLEDTRVLLTVTDNGVGFAGVPLGARGRPRHYGVRHMHTRARQVGGRLDIVSRPGQGTTVRLAVPLRGRAAEGDELSLREGSAETDDA
jgi:signal transduction histidine kinase